MLHLDEWAWLATVPARCPDCAHLLVFHFLPDPWEEGTLYTCAVCPGEDCQLTSYRYDWYTTHDP